MFPPKPHIKSTRFFEYLCLQILPQLQAVEEDDSQNDLLRFLAVTALNTGVVSDPKKATENVVNQVSP